MSGTLYTLGMGPGDPELLTLKAARLIGACPVVAHFAKRGRAGHARSIAGALVRETAEELRFEYPYTVEIDVADPRYLDGMGGFYDACAARIAERLDAGQDVALLCEGDPFLYGSAMYLFDRLAGHRLVTVPGVPGMSGCWSRAGLPFTHGDDVLSVLPGTLDAASLVRRLQGCDAAVVMKLGRNLAKVRDALCEAGLAERAVYVERGTMAEERIIRLCDVTADVAPYFAMILVPGRQRPR
jgi:precorrin-2/cobalt-factor-2 C20-methyltransferase